MKTIIPFAAALALAFGGAQVLHADSGMQLTAGDQKSFEEVDANSDGQVTRDEADSAGVHIDWQAADPDGSGSLTREEYDNAIGDQSGSRGM